ncbi:hypothetical protein PsorP6_017294 [Peronosclerospora sorghi]|uniref:Uncharacterized protein n=1 Tax=Peronosclerospora sorghi TaxID=230839 RepID=A0ACC0WM27_9STRA|nr:hypothetical protein PsorP6_017294 [Peronosclerospora sorghi]
MGEDVANTNSARYAERTEHADMLRATQEELAAKIKELQIYEANYVALKKDLARWKKKFEYVFRENELLALETGKLDASHKQIAFLQQEIKFKEEEGAALRGLVSALEAATKKQRAKQLEAAKARDSELEAAAALAAEKKGSEDADQALAAERKARMEEKERYSAEIAALKAENALLLKDVDRKEEEMQRQEGKINAHKTRIEGLQQALKEEQEAGMKRLKEKQEKVLDLENQIQQMQLRRRSSVAAALAKAEEEGRDMVGFGPKERLKASHISEGDENDSDDEPDTPPGTPPPISSGGLLPPEDPTADQIIRDWKEDKRIQAIERRRDSVLGGYVPGEMRFGRDHMFLGPSPEDQGKLVPHMPRVISTSSKASYVSKPKHVDPLATIAASSPQERSSEHTDDMDTSSESAELPDIMTSKRKWGGLNAAKFIGTMAAGAKQRVAATFKNAKYTHEGTTCQFCKMTPIVGERYSCATCVGFDLCENCYSLGGHGLENSDELFYRVQELVLGRCPRLAEEADLLELMRFEICRSNLRKFSFCLNWLADIVNGKTSRDLQARALEIPSIRRDVRKVFVPLLMRVCSDREDIEVKTEWELEDDNQAPVRSVGGGVSEGDGRFLETLRIWVADQYRTTSPFVERSLLKYREGDDEEEEDEGPSENGAESAGKSDGHGDTPEGEAERCGDAPQGSMEGSSSQPGFVERSRGHSDQF